VDDDLDDLSIRSYAADPALSAATLVADRVQFIERPECSLYVGGADRRT